VRVAVVIPSLGRESLMQTIQSLQGQEYDQLIVVKEGKNPAEARNIGLSMTEADIIAFIDDDVICHPDFIRQGKCFFEKHSEIDFMQGNVFGNIETLFPNRLFISANLWIRSGLHHFFDEDLKSSEDLDFCWRLLDRNRLWGYNKDCKVWLPSDSHYEDGGVKNKDNTLLEMRHPKRYKKLMEEDMCL